MDSPGSNRPQDAPAPAHGYVAEPANLTEAQYATLQMLRYVRLLLSRWILIVTATLGIGLGYGLYTKFLTVKWYRAQATITPVPPTVPMSTGGAGDMLEGVGGGLASIFNFGGASDTLTLSQRYIAIMNSYAFTMDLMNKYHLERRVIASRSKNAPTISKWGLHKQIASRFSSEYDYKSGNLSLYFLDTSPESAQRVLGYYLDSLRDKLRNEEVQSATSAAESLQEEVRKTSDALLQTQLYELMARQIQRAKVAQVQADFAFKMVEPPVVPDYYYLPSARRNAVLASVVTFVLICIWILASDFIRRAKSQYEALIQAPAPPQASTQPPSGGWAVGDPPAARIDEPAGSRPRFIRNLRS